MNHAGTKPTKKITTQEAPFHFLSQNKPILTMSFCCCYKNSYENHLRHGQEQQKY